MYDNSRKDYPLNTIESKSSAFSIDRHEIRFTHDVPTFHPIRVHPDAAIRERDRQAQAAVRQPFGPGFLGSCVVVDLQWFDASAPAWNDTMLVIDRDRKRVVWGRGEDIVLGSGYPERHRVSLSTFWMPILVAASPLIIAIELRHAARELAHGMSRHGVNLMRQIKGQLDPETELLLIETLRNEWKHDRKFRRTPSVRQARHLLQFSRGQSKEFDDVEIEGGERMTQAILWIDHEGDEIARAVFLTDGRVRLRVLGATFTGDVARSLALHGQMRLDPCG